MSILIRFFWAMIIFSDPSCLGPIGMASLSGSFVRGLFLPLTCGSRHNPAACVEKGCARDLCQYGSGWRVLVRQPGSLSLSTTCLRCGSCAGTWALCGLSLAAVLVSAAGGLVTKPEALGVSVLGCWLPVPFRLFCLLRAGFFCCGMALPFDSPSHTGVVPSSDIISGGRLPEQS